MSTKRALEQYETQDTTFASQREAKFMHAITDAYDAGDSEAFRLAVAEYDRYVAQSPAREVKETHHDSGPTLSFPCVAHSVQID